MTERLNYEKARQRDKTRAAGHTRRYGDNAARRAALQAFVDKHDLSCFSCNGTDGPWAKTGHTTAANIRHWAICVPCIEKRRADEG